MWSLAALGYLSPPVYAVPITLTISGTVTDNTGKAVAGVNVSGYLSKNPTPPGDVLCGGSPCPTAKSGQTNGMGMYPNTVLTATSPNDTGPVQWNIGVKQLDGAKTTKGQATGTFAQYGGFNYPVFKNTWVYSQAGYNFGTGVVVNGSGTATANLVTRPQTHPITYTAVSGSQKPPQLNADPTYSFVPSGSGQGTISFSSSVDSSQPPSTFLGLVSYADGSIVTDNGPTESILDQAMQISPIQVLGTNPDGSFKFSDAQIQIGDVSSGVFLTGNVVDIFASETASGPIFGGFLNVTALGGPSLNSTLIDEFSTIQSAGGLFSIGLDPTFLTATQDFSISASQVGDVEVLASVPAPAIGVTPNSFIVLLGGLSMFWAMRRRTRATSTGSAQC
jgi:hypothetical protein